MDGEYDHSEIEKKWQAEWERSGIYHAQDNSDKKKFYALVEFPYPSGSGLHIGHPRPYTCMDIVSRKRRMEGYNVLFPIGWDAFGLPTENYAIKTGKDPRIVTKENTDYFRKQAQAFGFSFDWSREINTTDSAYYKWTQWIFTQMFKKGLAYKGKATINWCPKDKIGLANEEVIDGKCERCGTEVEKREKEQWMLAITKYAERLSDDLDTVDYPARVVAGQRNWIGKSEGAEINFGPITVFTTRADTIYGATYVVLAPEHPLVAEHPEAAAYVHETKSRSDIERTAEGRKKTGVRLDLMVQNPATGESIPVYVADYVLGHYGTGAVMAVPAHDERDAEFAQKFKLPIKHIELADKEDMIAKFGTKVTKFKLRDWVFSRQRYWGEPIPMVHCADCGWQPVPDNALPVLLPQVDKYEPADNGESPLSKLEDWIKTTCPACGKEGRRETDVMPNWAGSSWYYLRYTDPHNSEVFASKKNLNHWTPVDWYNGGMEHTVLHLLYSRFWHKFLFDQGLVSAIEPYAKRTSHGLFLAADGSKISKSKGNGIDPMGIIDTYGADATRLYIAFIGPFEAAVPWQNDGLVGTHRFIEKVIALSKRLGDGEVGIPAHQAIKKVSEDIEATKFNTAVSTLMILTNTLAEQPVVPKASYEVLLKLLAPFAPHVTEELWHLLGNKGSVHLELWPNFDPSKLDSDTVTIAVQVSGKTRGTVLVKRGASQEEVLIAIQNIEKMAQNIPISPSKVIYVPNRVINVIP